MPTVNKCKHCNQTVSSTYHYCTSTGKTHNANEDNSFLTSFVIGAVTNNALLGGIIGGSIVGGLLGDLLDGNLFD